MIVKCEYCGREFNRKPSALKKENYCNKVCRHKDKYMILKCEVCGKTFERLRCTEMNHMFCSWECSQSFRKNNFSELAKKLNPTRMTEEIKFKLRQVRLGKGEGKAYAKTFGRHTHRVVAEEMLGRPLLEGEVVHHIDGNKRNNHPLNLMIFKTQAEHATWHLNDKINPEKNYE